jgi:hypothetical protein
LHPCDERFVLRGRNGGPSLPRYPPRSWKLGKRTVKTRVLEK